jgi:hypothetical protein
MRDECPSYLNLPHPSIPQNIVSSGFRFIKLRPRTKIPDEVGWQKDNNYTADDPHITRWISRVQEFYRGPTSYEGYGNYGVWCDSGHIVVDIDAPEKLGLDRKSVV